MRWPPDPIHHGEHRFDVFGADETGTRPFFAGDMRPGGGLCRNVRVVRYAIEHRPTADFRPVQACEDLVVTLRPSTRCKRLLLACGAFVLAAALPATAAAQGKLEARYRATLAGIEIGKGTWVVTINDTQFSAASSGITTGLMHVLTDGEGTSAVRGTLGSGSPLTALYGSTINTRKKSEKIRVSIERGEVKDFKVEPPPEEDDGRVPLGEKHIQGVLDPMTASLLRTAGNGDPVKEEACKRSLPVFDGRMRYDLKLSYKRMDHVKAEKGYSGPVVVCAVYFRPLAGHVPSRAAMKYLVKQREMEIWLAPIAGTRVLVPFKAQGPTPIGQAVLEATHFESYPLPSRASAGGPKTR